MDAARRFTARHRTRANNESQVEATKTALNRDPVVLIQGPPGTGKTRTILSLLSALLHAVPSSTKKTDIDFKHYAEMRESRPVMTAEELRDAWSRAAPWMSGAMNPRDAPPSSALTAESPRVCGLLDLRGGESWERRLTSVQRFSHARLRTAL